jgi:hypothetical protein
MLFSLLPNGDVKIFFLMSTMLTITFVYYIVCIRPQNDYVLYILALSSDIQCAHLWKYSK